MMKLLKKIKFDKSGASAAEYALMLAVMGGIVIIAITTLGQSVTDSLDAASDQLDENRAGD
ncbi:Flp family type IVb pilin [Polymorphobacter sp.]|uniref:Flp family type IVb pilin n=1 Tax=Polymorphobacter sp. TaxID=1909290 RepID=UPI003F7209FF